MKDIDYVKTFRIYIGLKQHFNIENNYEYVDWTKMSRIGVDSLLKRKDKKFFVGLTRKHHPNQYEYILSMFLKDPNMWVGEMLESKNLQYHQERMGRVNKLEYTVTSELEQLLLLNDLPLYKLLESNYNIPEIYKHKYISLETMAVINKIYNYTDKDTLNPLWNMTRHHINSYSKLLNIDLSLANFVEDNLKT